MPSIRRSSPQKNVVSQREPSTFFFRTAPPPGWEWGIILSSEKMGSHFLAVINCGEIVFPAIPKAPPAVAVGDSNEPYRRLSSHSSPALE